MTISEAQENHERALREFDAAHPYENSNGYRKMRNKALANVSSQIFEAIRRAQPKPAIDFQI